MDEDNNILPELKDLETKLGRKVPDSLVRSLVDGSQHQDEREKSHLTNCKCCRNSSDLRRLESKMSFLKQEMVSYTSFFCSIHLVQMTHVAIYLSMYLSAYTQFSMFVCIHATFHICICNLINSIIK